MSYNNSNNNSASSTSTSKWTYVGETTPNGTWIPAPSHVQPKSASAPVRMEPKPWVPVATQPVAVHIEEPKLWTAPVTVSTESLIAKAVSMGFSVDLQGKEGCWCDTESIAISIDVRQVEQYSRLLNVSTEEIIVGILAHEVGHGISHHKGQNPMDEVLAWKHAADLYGGTLPPNILALRTEALKGYLKPHGGSESAYVEHIKEVALSREYFRQEEIKRNERKAKEEADYQAKLADRRRRGTWK